ncbi:MAG: precorrin-6A reductase, partial [Coriobacteriales bacterium]|nr:precorrin-6A reductase [Coriobacteriales bacterium]
MDKTVPGLTANQKDLTTVRLLVFGGTTEGRLLAVLLAQAGVAVVLSVATDYGRETVRESVSRIPEKLDIQVARLSQLEMLELIEQGGFDYCIDATHPYAVAVTENIRMACEQAGLSYLRLLRPGGIADQNESLRLQSSEGQLAETRSICVPDNQAAVDYLKQHEGRVLLAIGSKELAVYTQLEGFAQRLYPRMLALPDSLNKALELGFRSANIYCMQGPFSYELNLAILKAIGASYLVTKDSGEVGGFEDKLLAAEVTGAQLIVIARPTDEQGYSFHEILRFFGIREPVENAEA